jgi:hypothetical protein
MPDDRCGRIDALKTKWAQVEFIDENVDHSHGFSSAT